ncbi:ParB/RepB/Spo0J family partition protein [Amaricoccus tamworthensis]|uniref:ParB/RepB/Spo0J family partition protein n=1 Tax=Amaricoccus tamworthensis TaxID=57002 RepID=UPI003C7BC9B2
MEKKGLGRGLSALLADVGPMEPVTTDVAMPVRGDQMIAIERVRANPDQPRRTFDDAELQDLASSIREKGIIQPLIVRLDPNYPDDYQIVAGERRWRAAQLANLHEIPAIIRELNDTEVLELAIIENIQRSDLNALEEALGYRQLMDRFGHTQERLSEALGKSRSHIANLLRLLSLPESVQEMVRKGLLSAGHARAIITSGRPEQLAAEIVKRQLSVRQAEQLAKKDFTKKVGEQKATGPSKDADTRALEEDLSATLSMKVLIDHKPGQQAGELRIKYTNLADLDRLCQLMSA